MKALALIVVLVLLPLPALAAEVSGVVVFGDSLSDPGNHFVAYGTIAHAPFAPIPDDSYAIGGHRFSNGATWAERLARALDAPAGAHPALRSPGVFTNYAVGRARARAGSSTFAAFDLGTQVGRFLADFGGHAAGGHLYVVAIGANDLQDALGALVLDPSGATSAGILQEALTAVAGQLVTLWASGARSFLVVNAPDLTITPAVRALGPAAQFAAGQLAAAYNAGLDQVLANLGVLPGASFTTLDLNALFADVVAAPAQAGLVDATEPCLSFGTVAHAICATPHRHLFWDGIHPTKRGHELIAAAALAALGVD